MAGDSKQFSLIFQAIDRVTAPLRGIESAVDRLGNAFTLRFLGAQAAINATLFSINAVGDALDAASKIELSNLGAAAGLEEALGSFDTASNFVEKLNKSLAIAAASLPGTTEQYAALARTISDDVVEAFADANGRVADPSKLQSTLESLSKNYTILGVGSGVTERDTQLFLTNALSGQSSTKMLMRINAVRKDARLRNALEEAIAERGITDIRKLNIEDRVSLFKEIGERLVTPAYLDRVSNTYESSIQSFISKLFDPNTGAFGLMKDLDTTLEGDQTAFDSVKRVLNTVIGKGGIFDRIGSIADSLNIGQDPMVTLRNGLDWLNGWLIRTSKGLEYIQLLLNYNFSLDQIANKLGAQDIGKTIAEFVNGIFIKLRDLDYRDITKKIFQGLSFIGQQFVGFLTNLDPQIYGIAFGAYLIPIVLTSLGTAISGILAVAFTASGINSIALAVFSVFGASITGAIGTIGAAILSFPFALAIAAAASTALLAYTVYSRFDEIKNIVMSALGVVFQGLLGAAEIFTGIITLNIPLVKDGIDRFFQALQDAFIYLTDAVAIALGQKTFGEIRADGALARADRQFEEAVKNNGGSAVIPARFEGQIPNAAGGLFNAVARETANKPIGSGIVVANSSETILTAAQTGNVAAALSRGGTPPFSPQIIINGVSADVDTLTSEVMRRLEMAFQEYKEAYL